MSRQVSTGATGIARAWPSPRPSSRQRKIDGMQALRLAIEGGGSEAHAGGLGMCASSMASCSLAPPASARERPRLAAGQRRGGRWPHMRAPATQLAMRKHRGVVLTHRCAVRGVVLEPGRLP